MEFIPRMEQIIIEIEKLLIEKKITIEATSNQALIVTDQVTGEEIIIKDLGYPL